ncbi:MAG: amidohydrolase family protein [Woeseia sp.]
MRRFWPLLLLAACQSNGDSPHYDLIIRGGTVYDGSLQNGIATDIGIRGDRIVSVAAEKNATASSVIDATGLMVMPGFIDPHTHATTTLRSPETSANLNYLTQGVTTVFIGNDGYGVSDASLLTFAEQGIGTNVATLVGHGLVRKQVMGMADRQANAAEITAMQEIVAEQMRAGAFGLSTGLFYAPGSYADTAEVIELARTAAQFNGIYDTHMRSESSHADGLLAALEETLLIGREAPIPVHISHLKALGKDMWGQYEGLLARINEARAAGIDVTANQYPWRASGTRFSSALVPRWVMADSSDKMRERLASAELLPQIRDEMTSNLALRGGPDAMLVSGAESPWRGQTLAEIATTMETDPVTAAIEVVLNGDPSIASFVMHPDVINAIAVQPWVMTGSDGSGGHPRLFGTYPKAWQDLVTTKLLSIPQFVHRSSGLVAETFGICDRGFIRNGAYADIAIIDAKNFHANATYEAPTELSDGVKYLLVNGIVAIDNSRYPGTLPGKILRHGACP